MKEEPMPLSRRAFVRTLGSGRAVSPPGFRIAARGREALEAALWPYGVDAAELAPPPAGEIHINSNENPLGPGPRAVEAIERAFGDAGRYPMNARPAMADLRSLLAKSFGVGPESVALGAGSGELLRAAVRAYTSPDRALVTAAPSFEAPERLAGQIGTPVKAIPVDAAGRLDLDRMGSAARGAGLIFVCNPNNPTGTVHEAAAIRDLVARVRRESPDTAILLDEAYHEYVAAPAYATAVPLALEQPRVLVSRTFSKAYGMAGLRVGCAVGQAATVKPLERYIMPYTVNVLGVAAAHACFQDAAYVGQERARNAEARRFTLDFFRTAGFAPMESHTNFVFVDLRRPAAGFREACRGRGVLIGREFPPLEKTHVRISIGTMDEMRRATEVFAEALGAPATSHRGN
jgi:histidinol-phosphate aminotransferase